MTRRRAGCAAALLLATAGPAAAQSPPADRTAPVAQAAAPPAIDVSRLPISVSRIQRELQRSAIRDESEGLNLRYVVDVFGQAPPIRLFAPEPNLFSGPTPHGAPTHQDMLNQMTPREFRSPAADLNALLRWLADRARRD